MVLVLTNGCGYMPDFDDGLSAHLAFGHFIHISNVHNT